MGWKDFETSVSLCSLVADSLMGHYYNYYWYYCCCGCCYDNNYYFLAGLERWVANIIPLLPADSVPAWIKGDVWARRQWLHYSSVRGLWTLEWHSSPPSPPTQPPPQSGHCCYFRRIPCGGLGDRWRGEGSSRGGTAADLFCARCRWVLRKTPKGFIFSDRWERSAEGGGLGKVEILESKSSHMQVL